MILDRLEYSHRYHSLHPMFRQAFDFLKDRALAGMKTERHDLAGPGLYAIITKDPGKTADAARLEAHRKYIDIHYTIGGVEKIGWRSLDSCAMVDSPYNDEKDVQTFRDDSETWSVLSPGTFAIFFSEDAHAPMVAEGVVHKAVIKVAL